MNETEHRKVYDALAEIGADETLRARFVALLREVETHLARPDFSVRDEITGPIVDALHADAGVLRKTLACGTVFEFHYRSKIAREFVMSGEDHPDHVWEPQTTKLLVHLSRKARNVVIGGAYSGDQAILVAKTMAPAGGVCHAFEPNTDQLRMLERNARNNRLDNVVFNRLGLWQDGATMLKLVGDDSFAHPEVADAAASDAFATVSINAYGADRGLARIDLIMLDIEGAELPALRGADRYLSQPAGSAPNVVFEVHRHYVDWSRGLAGTDIARFMTGLGYTLFAVRDFNSNVSMGDAPIELVPADAIYLDGPPHGFNMLAVKDAAAILADPAFRLCRDVSPKLLWHRDPKLHHPMHARAS
ncbi:MAG: FkbM family methyltransferase [Rhodospirillales bacterium]